ncbi:hypothetical protein ACJ41O_000122 [Fusarium nematophilum]
MSPSSPLRFDNRVAIVTGSGRGLGREYALLLGRLGASVVVNSVTRATTQTTVDDIVKAGGRAVPYVGSVADRAVADGIVQKAIDTFGRIDIVVNNAGLGEVLPFESFTPAQLWDMLGLHVGGAFNVTQAAWPHMQKQKYGRVVMIASHAMFGLAMNTTYATAKMALVGLGKSLAVEGKAHNIFVNSIATSGFTPSVQKNIQDEGMQALIKQYMPASEVAPAVLWLVHEDSEVNGETFGAAGRVVTRIFFAETDGFQGSAGGEWSIETVRDNWDKIVDEKNFTIHTNSDNIGPAIFQRLSSGQAELSADTVAKAFER